MRKLSVDSHFEIGSSHDICQDYAISDIINYYNMHGAWQMAYGIVCDGCSSSRHVDLGARYLAMATVSFLNNLKNIEDVFKMNIFDVADEILSSISCLPDIVIDNNGLDATLVFFVSDGYTMRVFFYGDGYVVMKNKETTTIIKAEYESNAPYYLSYLMNSARREAYINQFGNSKYIIETTVYSNNDGSVISTNKDEQSALLPYSFVIEDPSEIVSIFSDGLGSFFGNPKINLTKEELTSVMMKYVNYPQVNGEFALRNFKFNKKNLIKNGILHDDDLSVATVITKEVQNAK